MVCFLHVYLKATRCCLDCLSEIKVYCLNEPADRPLHVLRTLVYLLMIHFLFTILHVQHQYVLINPEEQFTGSVIKANSP